MNSSIKIGDRTLTFPTALESGSYLEFRSADDCGVYDAKGELVGVLQPRGNIPQVEAGHNVIRFSCNIAPGVSARAKVTIISQDDKFISQ